MAAQGRGHGRVAVTRGEVVTIALSGSYGKPRPALVIQSDLFNELVSLTILPITSELRDAPLIRIPLQPDSSNGLRMPSQVMIDKIQAVPRGKVGKVIGALSDDQMVAVTRSLAVFLGMA